MFGYSVSLLQIWVSLEPGMGAFDGDVIAA